MQMSGCTSALKNRALDEARTLAPDRAVVKVERYGVPPGHAPVDTMLDGPLACFENHTVSQRSWSGPRASSRRGAV
jgi:hypothetical protein